MNQGNEESSRIKQVHDATDQYSNDNGWQQDNLGITQLHRQANDGMVEVIITQSWQQQDQYGNDAQPAKVHTRRDV